MWLSRGVESLARASLTVLKMAAARRLCSFGRFYPLVRTLGCAGLEKYAVWRFNAYLSGHGSIVQALRRTYATASQGEVVKVGVRVWYGVCKGWLLQKVLYLKIVV